MSLIPAEQIDREAILKAFNINPRDPKAQAMILACEKYGLDPLLKHAVLISGNLYVTRDGLLHVAHRDGRLDGIVIEDEGETAQEWWAKVTVYVKGQTHGYTYRGRYPKSGQQKKYGPEMAVKVAEVMALRRAFGVTGIATVEEQWDKSDALAGRGSQIEAGEAPRGDPSGSGLTQSAAVPPPPETVTGGDAGETLPPDHTGPAPSGDTDDIVDAEIVDDDPLDLLRQAMADAKPPWPPGKVMRRAKEIAMEELGMQYPPADFDALARPEYQPILARLAGELEGAAA